MNLRQSNVDRGTRLADIHFATLRLLRLMNTQRVDVDWFKVYLHT